MTSHDETDSWMLDELRTVRGVRHVAVLTSDGLLRVRSADMDDDVADKLAATCAGLSSLGQGVSTEFGTGGGTHQVMIEFDGGHLFLRGAGDGSRLAVVTGPVIDPGLVAQQMRAQVQKIGERALGTFVRGGHP